MWSASRGPSPVGRAVGAAGGAELGGRRGRLRGRGLRRRVGRRERLHPGIAEGPGGDGAWAPGERGGASRRREPSLPDGQRHRPRAGRRSGPSEGKPLLQNRPLGAVLVEGSSPICQSLESPVFTSSEQTAQRLVQRRKGRIQGAGRRPPFQGPRFTVSFAFFKKKPFCSCGPQLKSILLLPQR